MYSNRGPQVRELEARLATLLEAQPEQVVTVPNATLGLMGALALSGQHDWVAPSWTFSATIAAALQAQKAITLVDVRSADWWIDAPPGTSGILAVAPFGAGFDTSMIDPERETVIDAAASLGAHIAPLAALPARSAVVFSLGATKVFGVGEGGFVVFGDVERARQFISWTMLGFAEHRTSDFLGINARMPEITAVVSHAALDEHESELNEWQAARALANEVEAELSLTTSPSSGEGVNPYWVVQLADAATRHRVELELTRANIEFRHWWGAGCHHHPAYSALPRVPVPVTEHLGATTIGLPFFRDFTRDDAMRVREALARGLSA